MGVFFQNQFFLTVSFEYPPSADELTHLEDLLLKVSGILFDATEGQHSIGGVTYAVESGGDVADILVHFGGDSLPDSNGANLWIKGESIDMWRDYMTDATHLAHELAHYLYDVLDEYIDYEPHCVATQGASTCLMELYETKWHSRWRKAGAAYVDHAYESFNTYLYDRFGGGAGVVYVDGEPSEFCRDGTSANPGDHDPGTQTRQNLDHGANSCWTWMAADANHDNLPYALTIPMGAPVAATPAGLPALPVPIPLVPADRAALVLDLSGSMTTEKLAGLQVAASTFIDKLEVEQQFAMVTFAGTATVLTQLQEVPADGNAAWRNDRRLEVQGLTSGGSTAIGDALMTAADELTAVDLAANQALVLLSDGIETAGTVNATAALPDLVASHLRVYPIGFGTDQNAVLLQYLATATGGEYLTVDAGLSPVAAAEAVIEEMIFLSGDFPEDSLVALFEDVDESRDGRSGSPPFRWRPNGAHVWPISPTGPEVESLTFPVEISQGSTECTIGAYWTNPQTHFQLELIRPDGSILKESDTARRVRRQSTYAFDVVREPQPGTWHVRLRGPAIRGTRFRVFGFQVHPKLRFQATAARAIIRPGEVIQLRVRLGVPQPIPGARVLAWVLPPEGDWVQVSLQQVPREQGGDGAYTARFPSQANLEGCYLMCIDASGSAGTTTYRPDPARWIGKKKGPEARRLDIPNFALRTLLTVVADAHGRFDGQPLHGMNSRAPKIPAGQADRVQAWWDTHPRRQ